MTPEMMYVTQTLYLAIRNATVLFLPFALAFMMEANVSLERFKVSCNLFILGAELLQTLHLIFLTIEYVCCDCFLNYALKL